MISLLVADFQIIFDRDPSARSWLEILTCYPGWQALLLHRLAYCLAQLNVPFFPRLLSYFTRWLTGVEIHPRAKIGKGVFIDHGMGVVIGETTVIGDYCLIYQGVTLGGTGKENGKRHPTLGTNVVVGAGAKILGNLLIGDDVRIGAGSVVLKDVPSHSTVVGVPGRVVLRSKAKADILSHDNLQDPNAVYIKHLVARIEHLEKEFRRVMYNSEPV